MSLLTSILSQITDKPNRENLDSLDVDHQLKILHNRRFSSDTEYRKGLAIWAAAVVSVWLAFVIIILMHNARCYHLSDTVLSLLLGTTTLNILGLSYIVLKGLFNSQTIVS